MLTSLIRTATQTAALASIVILSLPASAGTLVVSGDSNIGNAPNGSRGATPANHSAFFPNLLGSGTNVLSQYTTNTDGSEVNSAAGIKSFHSGLAGVTLSSISAPVTGAQLAGVSLFIAFLPDMGFSSASTTAIKNFLTGGGSALLTAEFVAFDAQSINGNALLSGIGSGISLSYAATTATVGGSALCKTTNGQTFVTTEVFAVAVPEPSTYALMFGGLLAMGAVARRRKG